MRTPLITSTFLLAWLIGAWFAAAQPPTTAVTADDVIKRIQSTYDCGGFTAHFDQASTLEAMDITDTASGRAYFLEPGRMRWEYVEPEPQQIITDGKKLWIYKPLENQVLTGDISSMFQDGQGVSLLAAMRNIQEQHEVSLDPDRNKEGFYTLKLVPKDKSLELATIYLYVSEQSGLIKEIETVNVYGDTTRITFSDIQLGGTIDPSLFAFTVPENADVLLLDPPE